MTTTLRQRVRSHAIVRAVANEEVDVAIVWGPLAGFYARNYPRLRLASVMPEVDPPALPLAYDIALGVRKSDHVLLEELNAALLKAQPQIESILRRFHVPVVARHARRENVAN